jgi:enoyl-CoA hydratase/carnithine racemase
LFFLYKLCKDDSRRTNNYDNRKEVLIIIIITPPPSQLSSPSSNNNKYVHFSHDPTSKIGTMTLHSPTTKHNPLTVEMGNEFRRTVQDINTLILNNELNINTIILHGANSTFSAGGDINWLLDLGRNSVHMNADLMYDFYQSFLCVRKLQVPVISAIDGYAIGAGACLAIATDIRVVSKSAKIGFNFVRLGIHSGMGGSHFLPIAVGEAKAMEILLTGQVLTGEEAKSLGLVQRVVEDTTSSGSTCGQDVLEEAKRVAARIGRMNPLAVRSMVQTMRSREDSMGMGLDHALRREAHAQAICYAR